MARNPGIPHYLRIADKLAARLATEATGWRLPSVQALALSEKVSINTANRALAELQDRGMVISRRGSGTYSLGREGPVVQVFGYLVDLPHFAAFFRSLTERLARQGFRVVLTDTGLYGEKLAGTFRPREVAKAVMVVWLSTSHPEGIRICKLARRRLPIRLPMVAVANPMGLDLEGGHRFDLLHWNTAQRVRELTSERSPRDLRKTAWIQRRDIETIAMEEARAAFLNSLVQLGVSDPLDHILPWDSDRPGSLADAFRELKGWRPQSVILEYDYEELFRSVCQKEKINLPENVSISALGRVESRKHRLATWRDLARSCADLISSRLADPNRPNLKVSIAPPRRRNRASGNRKA